MPRSATSLRAPLRRRVRDGDQPDMSSATPGHQSWPRYLKEPVDQPFGSR